MRVDFLKLVVYLSFFFILLVFYGLPIHIMRDVFLTCRSFFKRLSDFIKYRTATRDMNERYPDATAEEIAREDTCIICREEMRPYAPVDGTNAVPEQAARNLVAERMRPKKLPCGHVLHFACLRSWLERQQICPTCRQPVLPNGRTPPPGDDQAAANAAPGQLPAAVPGQPVVDQADQENAQRAERQNRFRMLNLGPLRIGFGAGRGDLVNDLAHQINDHARNGQPGNQDHVPQYGFGFGFGRPRAPLATTNGTANIHAQLNTIEQRLQQEVSELRMAANELHIVRMLEAELNRLRTLRQAAAGQPVAAPTALLQAAPSATAPPVTIRPAQAFVANSQQPVLAAGSDALPEGLTLPPGWTMMPLHRLDAMARTAPPVVNNGTRAPANPQAMSAQGRTPSAPTLSPPQTTPQPPDSADGGLAGLSLTSSLNHDSPSHGDGASAGPSSGVRIAALSSTPTNREEGLPSMNSSSAPAAISSIESPNPPPMSVEDHEDSLTALPSLPTWGSSTPLAVPVPSRPSAPAQSDEGYANVGNPSDGASTMKDGPARVPVENGVNHDTQGGRSTSSSSKGKSKAATVEDFIEDAD
jgi:E3 ubiquitin-protein ligase synoviolin